MSYNVLGICRWVSPTGANPMWRSFLRGNEPKATDLAKNVARSDRMGAEHIPFVMRWFGFSLQLSCSLR